MKLSSSTQMVLASALLVAGAAWMLSTSPSTSNSKAITQTGNTFYIRHVRVFDGERVIENQDLFIKDGIISDIGESLNVNANVEVYDGRGKTLLPGLIDAHTHSYGDARREALRFGVTTELEMFGDWQALKEAVKQRESYTQTDRADLWTAGTLATAPGGHGTEYGSVPTLTEANEADAFVEARVNEGSDYIKIVLDDGHAYHNDAKMNTLSADTTQALINAAHRQHKMALFHIGALNEAQRAVTQGADGLVHIFIDQVADQNFINSAQEKHIFIVPTLAVTAGLSGDEESKALLNDQQLAVYLTPAQRQMLQRSFPPNWQNKNRLTTALQSVKALHDAGVPLLAGTDAGNPSTAHGISLHSELALLVRAGLTPIEALRAATSQTANTFHLNDRGAIKKGLRADLVLVNGEPDHDIHATRAIEHIWKNGFSIAREISQSNSLPDAAPPRENQISDFEQAPINSRYGQGWTINTDQMLNGHSNATLSWKAGGAQQSAGALLVKGDINEGFTYPWAGAMFVAADNESTAVNYSAAKDLVFWVKGDGRRYQVMTFASGASGIPPSQDFVATADWQEIRLPLSEFAGWDRAHAVAISFVAIAPVGSFEFMIDNVHIE